MTLTERVPVNNDKGECESDRKVLKGDDDSKEETPAGATAVGGDGRNADGRAGNSAASDGRPAAAGRAGRVARAPARRAAPRLADSLRQSAVATPMNPAEIGPQEGRDAVPPRR